MTQDRIDDLLSMIVDNLVSVSSMEAFDAVYDTTDYRVTSIRISELIHSAIKASNLRMMDSVPYFFTGKIYEPITNAIVDRAVRLWLFRMRVKSMDMFYSKKRFSDSAKEALMLKENINPAFHIKAYRNGVMDFEKGEFSDFHPRFHVTYIHDYNYDATARCPTWHSFLKMVLPEKESRLILQMFLGLCTMNRGKMGDKVENCLMLYGNGSNGKGVIFETVRGILGNHNVSTMSLMQLIKGGDERMRNLAAIEGKVVNFCPEINAKDMSGYEDAFKSLCSGEAQHGRKIGKDVHAIVNIPWLIFSMNNIPRASDCSYGYFRRYLYVIFNFVVPEEMQNKHLAEDLKKEYPGILNWMHRGAKYLKQRKYKFPTSENSEHQKKMDIAQSDVVAAWKKERGFYFTQKGNEDEEWFKASELYDDMVDFAELNGLECRTSKKGFGIAMVKLGAGVANKVRTAESVMYKLYGMTHADLRTPPPVVNCKELGFKDEDEDVIEYDEDDL